MAEHGSFGAVVLGGLGGGTLAAVAGARPWAEGRSGTVDTATDAAAAQLGSAQEMPLAAALALVVLACWGVVLVTRGRVRRTVAALGALAAAGLVVTCVVGFSSVQDSLTGALLTASGTDTATVSLTGWFWAACVGAVISLATTVAAVARAPRWPEMGSRYDAPGAGTGAAGGGTGGSNLELWKALDEGEDPTVDGPADHTADHTADTDDAHGS
jgi:hypothetical protein